jgi:BASS family bile acid:Na+ symporter
MKSAFLIVFFPVVFGFLFKYFNPKLKIDFLPKISEFLIALIIGIIFSLNLENIKDLSLILLLCILFHNILGLLIGYMFATFLKFPKQERKTISIEVGMQNSGLGMALSIIHFSKLVALPSAIFSLLHNISGVTLVYFWKKK